MKQLLALALLAAAAPAAAETIVQTAETDWSYLPAMEHITNNHLDNIALAGIHNVVERGDCALPGQSKREMNLTVPFAVQFTPDGQLAKLVIKKLGCAEIEGIVAGALLEMVKGGDYRPVRRNAEGWYRGDFSFVSKG